MTAAIPSRSSMQTFDPAQCESRQIYKLMTGIIVPRPIALVSTIDANGVANLAPFSFFSGVGSVPPSVLFCPALRSAGTGEPAARKDTLRNVEETREFVVNVVSERHRRGCQRCGCGSRAGSRRISTRRADRQSRATWFARHAWPRLRRRWNAS